MRREFGVHAVATTRLGLAAGEVVPLKTGSLA